MKLIQLNVQEFRHFDAIKKYLQKEQADIITMQEVVDKWFGHYNPPLDSLDQLRELWYTIIYWANFGLNQKDSSSTPTRGNAIATTYEVIHHQQHFFYPYGTYTTKTADELWWQYNEEEIESRTKRWIISRTLPCSVLEVLIKTDEHKIIRLLTTHFPPSPKCTETFQMIQMATFLKNILEFSSPLPTILAGDFNLQAPSASFFLLQEHVSHITDSYQNTLNKQFHIWFKNDIPESWFQVDHIFADKMWCTQRYADNVDISDHLPVVAHFSI